MWNIWICPTSFNVFLIWCICVEVSLFFLAKTVQVASAHLPQQKIWICSACVFTTWTYLCQLVVAEVQVDQRVQLGEARQLVQLVPSQVEGLDVAQTGVSSFQDPQVVIGQIHVDQVVQVLQSSTEASVYSLWQSKQTKQALSCIFFFAVEDKQQCRAHLIWSTKQVSQAQKFNQECLSIICHLSYLAAAAYADYILKNVGCSWDIVLQYNMAL